MRLRAAILALAVLSGCQRSRVTDVPVVPPVVASHPDFSPDIATVRVDPGADPSHLHISVVREHHDSRQVDVPLHPTPEDLAPALADLGHGARLVVVPDPVLDHAAAVAVLDALHAAGYTHFALSR